jgi:hypothetical protein
VAPYRLGDVTDRQSMGRNPTSPRVSRHGQGFLTVSWHLVPFEVCIEIEIYALLWKKWMDFPYLVCIFYVREITSLISLEDTSEGKWLVAHFLLPSQSHGCGRLPSLEVEALD